MTTCHSHSNQPLHQILTLWKNIQKKGGNWPFEASFFKRVVGLDHVVNCAFHAQFQRAMEPWGAEKPSGEKSSWKNCPPGRSCRVQCALALEYLSRRSVRELSWAHWREVGWGPKGRPFWPGSAESPWGMLFVVRGQDLHLFLVFTRRQICSAYVCRLNLALCCDCQKENRICRYQCFNRGWMCVSISDISIHSSATQHGIVDDPCALWWPPCTLVQAQTVSVACEHPGSGLARNLGQPRGFLWTASCIVCLRRSVHTFWWTCTVTQPTTLPLNAVFTLVTRGRFLDVGVKI